MYRTSRHFTTGNKSDIQSKEHPRSLSAITSELLVLADLPGDEERILGIAESCGSLGEGVTLTLIKEDHQN